MIPVKGEGVSGRRGRPHFNGGGGTARWSNAVARPRCEVSIEAAIASRTSLHAAGAASVIQCGSRKADATAKGVARRPLTIVSLGLNQGAVNDNLMSYIRHITYNFLLDGKGCFVVKLQA